MKEKNDGKKREKLERKKREKHERKKREKHKTVHVVVAKYLFFLHFYFVS